MLQVCFVCATRFDKQVMLYRRTGLTMYFNAAFRRRELSVNSFWAMKGYASSTCAHNKAHTYAGLTGCLPGRQAVHITMALCAYDGKVGVANLHARGRNC